MKTGRTVKSPNKSKIKLAKTHERGINSLGNENCFKTLAWAGMETAASCKEVAKNVQGSRAAMINS